MDTDQFPTSQGDHERQSQPPSDMVGHGRPAPDALSQKHTLTTFEALKIFEREGLPRSQRSLERYCKVGKLDCFADPDEQRYYITEESVERLIGHLKEIAARHEPSDMVGHGRPVSDSGGQSPTWSEDVVGGGRPVTEEHQRAEEMPDGGEKDKRIQELEHENMDLKINNRAKDYFIERLEKDRENFVQERHGLIDRIANGMRRIGILENKLLQLGAPKEEEHNEYEGEVVETTE